MDNGVIMVECAALFAPVMRHLPSLDGVGASLFLRLATTYTFAAPLGTYGHRYMSTDYMMMALFHYVKGTVQ